MASRASDRTKSRHDMTRSTNERTNERRKSLWCYSYYLGQTSFRYLIWAGNTWANKQMNNKVIWFLKRSDDLIWLPPARVRKQGNARDHVMFFFQFYCWNSSSTGPPPGSQGPAYLKWRENLEGQINSQLIADGLPVTWPLDCGCHGNWIIPNVPLWDF